VQLRVLTVRNFLAASEDFRIECFVLTAGAPPSTVSLYTAPLSGRGEQATWTQHVVPRVTGDGDAVRGVYATVLPPPATDFMWYLAADVASGETIVFPPTAPATPQHVVIVAAQTSATNSWRE
jgi:hypothetical protein